MARSAKLDQSITRNLREKLSTPAGTIMAEYIWIGGSGSDLRSKTRTITTGVPKKAEDLPIWNYDGSSTGQAPGEDSEVFLKPAAIYKDPFRGGDHVLVMCETWLPPYANGDGSVTEMAPHPTNTRNKAKAIFDKAAAHAPWFGLEQEYTLLDSNTQWPLGWPLNGYPGPQGPYYCGAGAGVAIGRDVMELHYSCCLHAGVNISGTNGEVMPAQWEYQVGPCEGIKSGDDMWISRYLLTRVCELFDVTVSLDPKPIPGDWNGAGCHMNYSTAETRVKGTGWSAMQAQIARLAEKHEEHIAAYGEGNERRLTGAHETADIGTFSWGVANRGCSIRVPRQVPIDTCGYYEDRRPASNVDPYVCTSKMVETTLL